MSPEPLVFFVDRCLGRGLWSRLRAEGIRAEHKDDHFPQDAKDEEWMSVVGERGWVVLTRDTRIRFHPSEREAIFRSGLRFFSLQTKRGAGGKRGISGKEMAELILKHFEKIEEMARTVPAPFIAGITRSEVRIIFRQDDRSDDEG